MFRRVSQFVVVVAVIVAMIVSGRDVLAGGYDHGHSVSVLLRQQEVPSRWQVGEEFFGDELRVLLGKWGDWQLVPLVYVEQEIEQVLVDEAVFEILVTGDLVETLAHLEANENEAVMVEQYCRGARAIGVDMLVDVSIRELRSNMHVTYRVIDTSDGCCVAAKSFWYGPNLPGGADVMISRRLERTLWQVEHLEVRY